MVAAWDRRSPDEQERVQRLLLRQWLPEVAAYSPYWSERFARAGIDPGKAQTFADLRGLAPLREADVAHLGGPGSPALLQRPTEAQARAQASGGYLLDVARAIRRQGEAGKRLAFLQEYKPIHLHRGGLAGDLTVAYTRSDLDRLHRAGARAAALLGLRDSDYLVGAVPARPTLDFWGIYHLALGASLLAVHPRGAGEPLDAAAEGFELVPATAVAVGLDEAVPLAAAVMEAGSEVAGVRTVVVVGPPPAPDQRARIAEAWRAAGAASDLRVIAAWAPAEARALWVECRDGVAGRHGPGLHTFPDLEVLELVDPVSPGRTAGLAADGDLTCTSAGWHGTALLRYQTGHYVEHLERQPCDACGRTVPRLAGEIVEHAWQPAVTTPRGKVYGDLRGAAAVLGSSPSVAAWRVEMRGPTSRQKHDRLLVEVAPGQDQAALADLEDALAAAVGIAPTKLTALEDPAALQARIAQVGSAFADLR